MIARICNGLAGDRQNGRLVVDVLHGGGVFHWHSAVEENEGQGAGRQHEGEVRLPLLPQAPTRPGLSPVRPFEAVSFKLTFPAC